MRLRRQPSPTTNLSWKTKRAIWHRWALGEDVDATLLFFRENGHSYDDAPFDRDTVREARAALYLLPVDVLEKLIGELPEMKDFLYKTRPDLVGELEAAPGNAATELGKEPPGRDPTVEEAKVKHNEDLIKFLKRVENTMHHIIDGEGLTAHQAVAKNDWHRSQGYQESFWWHTDGGRVSQIVIDFEQDPLFQCLAQHLKDEKFWKVYQQWRTAARQCLEIWRSWYAAEESDLTLLKRAKQLEETAGRAVLASAREACLYDWIPGRCGMCGSYYAEL